MKNSLNIEDKIIIAYEDFQQLLDALLDRDYQVIGPTLRDNAIVYDEISSISELPSGYTDEQDGGRYRIKKRDDGALFGYAVGPHSWKKFLHPPVMSLWKADRTGDEIKILEEKEDTKKYAFIGVRSCELHAIAIQDKVFMEGKYVEPSYKLRRENAFIIAVNCTQAGGTCFCVSMNTGPKATFGFDIVITEVLENNRHYFLAEVGTEAGAEVLGQIPYVYADDKEKESSEELVMETKNQMGREMDTTDIKDLLYRNYENPCWENIANRCLTCANCTMVCPTCFCTTVEDTTDLTGKQAERVRKWDSCFTMDFSYIHGGTIRSSTKSRYRQWMTHKLATWIEQFGTSGCVGCGRCITWCPVAIDITEEVQAIRQSDNM
jgi:ferredoxin